MVRPGSRWSASAPASKKPKEEQEDKLVQLDKLIARLFVVAYPYAAGAC